MKDDRLYLVHMLECVYAILSYMENVPLENLRNAGMLQDAVLHNLQLIGKNAKNISDETLATIPNQPWHKIRGLRNLIVHEYVGINMEIIVNVVEHHLEPLRQDLEVIVGDIVKRS
jgi:uncharacterized protein with HEPN domain